MIGGTNDRGYRVVNFQMTAHRADNSRGIETVKCCFQLFSSLIETDNVASFNANNKI